MSPTEVELKIEQRQERAFGRWTAGMAAVVGLITLLLAILGGVVAFWGRIAVDEERQATQKAQLEQIGKTVDGLQKDSTETRNDVKWIIHHWDDK